MYIYIELYLFIFFEGLANNGFGIQASDQDWCDASNCHRGASGGVVVVCSERLLWCRGRLSPKPKIVRWLGVLTILP